MDALCIGHAAYDLTLVVPEFPREDSKTETSSRNECGGGPASNAAYLLSAWGRSCAFAGLCGDDLYGRRIADEFREAGTDLSLFELRPGHPTPVSCILVNQANGSRTIVTHKPPLAFLPAEGAPFAGLSPPRLLLFDGHEPALSLAALDAFPEALSVLDAGSVREGTLALAPRVGFLAASEKFARQLTGLALEDDSARRECLRRMRERYPIPVAVTLGSHGLIADDGAGYFHLPAFPAAAVDTTGAGDLFHGALAHALLDGASFREALTFASMTASLSVRKLGGRTSLPQLEVVREALAGAR